LTTPGSFFPSYCGTWFVKQTLEAKADARAYIGPLGSAHCCVSVSVSEWVVSEVCVWVSICVSLR
jgi:hypothetical protein